MPSFIRKFITSLVAGLTLAALLLVLGNSGTLPWFPPVLVFSLVGLSLLLSVIFPFLWQYGERRQSFNSVDVYAFLLAFIRYCIAFNVASFGWKKLFGLQFLVPVDVASKPMNQQPGEILTWFYFGYSPTFGTIIALLQIVGSYFLLFRRTSLLSSIVLFTLILNIALVDIFYNLNAGATTQGVLLTLGLLFLISTEYSRLVDFFLSPDLLTPPIPLKNRLTNNMLRLSAIIFSLLFVYFIARL
jgi:hypothetical protein